MTQSRRFFARGEVELNTRLDSYEHTKFLIRWPGKNIRYSYLCCVGGTWFWGFKLRARVFNCAESLLKLKHIDRIYGATREIAKVSYEIKAKKKDCKRELWQQFGGPFLSRESREFEEEMVKRCIVNFQDYKHLYDFAVYKNLMGRQYVVKIVDMGVNEIKRKVDFLPTYEKHKHLQWSTEKQGKHVLSLPFLGLDAGVYRLNAINGNGNTLTDIKVWEHDNGWAWRVLKQYG